MELSNLKLNTNSKGIITQSISPEERRKRDQEAKPEAQREESQESLKVKKGRAKGWGK